MRTIDLSPLYRSFIGTDQLAQLLNSAYSNDKHTNYPPYNIESLNDDDYEITIAVAGFAEKDISIEAKHNSLVVSGEREPKNKENRTFLHKGISDRSFKHTFQLGDHVSVTEAHMKHGVLHIGLKRVIPEELKPRKIAIGSR